MREHRFLTAAAALALLAGSAAVAGDGDYVITDWFDVGNGLLGADEAFTTDIDLHDEGLLGVVGFEVRFDYSEPVVDDSWGSDAQAIVMGPLGDRYQVGGFSTLPLSDEEWSFQGGISDAPGRYGDSGEDIFLPWAASPLELGVYNVLFKNDWASDPNPNLYDVQIRFYQAIPAPGALALLGLAGIVSGRRRRR